MSADGRFLKYLAKELNNELTTGKIQKVSQISKTDFLYLIRAQGENKNLYLSLSTSLSRLHLIEANNEHFISPGGFCMFMRKHLEGGTIHSIETLNNDRIIEVSLSNVNDLGDKVLYKMIIELFGRYANLIILNSEDKIINAYKHIHPFEDINRTIINGYKYSIPEDNKIDPENLNKIETFFARENITYKDIIENIRGISPLLAKAILKKANFAELKLFDSYLELLNKPINPTLKLESKPKFYFIDIFSEPKQHFNTISNLLEHYFQERSNKEKVKQIHKYLLTFTKTHLNRNKNKLEKLTKDYKKAENNEIYRIKGDLIIQDQHKISNTDYKYTGYSYEIDQDLDIDLDRKYSVIENANKYYKRYKKLKSALKHIKKQIILTKHEINYFINLKQQIENNFNLNDLEEIKEELVNLKYLPKRKSKKQTKAKLNFDTYIDSLGIKIVVGKNNLQNNYLTHKFAKKNYVWFHVQNQSGSHTIVCDENLKEETIRSAANLAAYFSKSRNSSSVAVDYTQVKNIKKIPGELGSYVSYTKQKTIYIDPDIDAINQLKKVK
ncbi:MAG: NFACT family protein [Candidatus Izimaplasma sp.]|nr:NFACT family protein [Candidatus Izimaplasma bacterium]